MPVDLCAYFTRENARGFNAQMLVSAFERIRCRDLFKRCKKLGAVFKISPRSGIKFRQMRRAATFAVSQAEIVVHEEERRIKHREFPNSFN